MSENLKNKLQNASIHSEKFAIAFKRYLSMLSTHVNGCVIVVFVCEASIAAPHLPYSLKCACSQQSGFCAPHSLLTLVAFDGLAGAASSLPFEFEASGWSP